MANEYREEIIDHYKNPRNFGELADKDKSGKGINAACGDMVEFYVKENEGKVMEVKWRGVGCAMSTAAASLLSEQIKGEKIIDIEGYDEKTMENLVGAINPGRLKCVMLPLSALKEALKNNG